MKKEQGFSAISLIIAIVLIVIIIGVIASNAWKILNEYKEEDTEFNKIEVVDTLNNLVKGKYVLDSKFAQENNKNIDEIYSQDTVIQYFLENKYIEPLKDISNNLVADQYYINPDALNSDIATDTLKGNGTDGNGTKIFNIKKLENRYLIYFVDKYGEEEELGEVNMKPEV